MAGRSILLCFCRRICSGSADAAARNAPQNRPSDLIDKIIRVDHAGELGADRIYAGQMAVLGNTSAGRPIKVGDYRIDSTLSTVMNYSVLLSIHSL